MPAERKRIPTNELPLSRWRMLLAIDPRSLALFRILLACAILYDLAYRSLDLAAMYGPDGVLPIETAKFFAGFGGWSLHYLHDSLAFQSGLFVVAALFAMALLVGYRTRLATVGSWVMLASLHSRMPVLVNGGDVLLACLLFWGMLLPLGCRWSLDVLAGRTSRLTRPIATVPAAAILLQVFMMYFFTGFAKFNHVWLSGEALHNALSYEVFVRPLGRWLLDYPLLLSVMTYGTLAGELICPLLLLFPWGNRYTRAIALAFFVLLHIGIELTMTVAMFSLAGTVGLTLFLPREFWRLRWLRLTGLWLRRVSPAAFTNRREARPPGRLVRVCSSPWLIAARNVACITLVAYLFVWNLSLISLIRYFKGAPMAPLGVPLSEVEAYAGPPREAGPPVVRDPGPLLQGGYAFIQFTQPLARATHLEQRWDMFSHPPDADYRFVARARLRDGSVVDVLRGGAAVDTSDLERLSPAATNVRWMLLYIGLTSDGHAVYAQDVAEYLRREWNRTHDDQRKVENLELLLLQHVPGGGRAFNERLIAEIGPRPNQRAIWGPDGEYLGSGPQRYGLRHGHWIEFEEVDGLRLRSEGVYERGIPVGLWWSWYENGQKLSEGRYTSGVRDGRWQVWKDGVWTYWHPNGAKREEQSWKNGIAEGPWTLWNPDGSLAQQLMYKNDQLDGRQVIYEADGAVRIELYRNGQPVDFHLQGA
jgi:hypothetical protein